MYNNILGVDAHFWDWAQTEPSERGQCVYTDSSNHRSGWHSEYCSRKLEFVICSTRMYFSHH